MKGIHFLLVNLHNFLNLCLQSESSSSSSSDEDEYDRRHEKGRQAHDRNRGRGGRQRKDDIDPMDPASYSDIPR